MPKASPTKTAVKKTAVKKTAVKKSAVKTTAVKTTAAKAPAAAAGMTKSAPATSGTAPARLIDGRIAELGDWRGEMLARVRALILEALPDATEEWKWRGVPVWYHGGMLCTGETYKAVVKVTFAKGASLPDPAGLFNSSMDGNVRRAIDIRMGEALDAKAFKALVRAAAALNATAKR